MQHVLPGDIERTSMAIIDEELMARGIELPAACAAVVKRVIHATADFDYAENLTFTERVVEQALAALRVGMPIVSDTNMARSGISASTCEKLGIERLCFMANPAIAEDARRDGTTRAVAAMHYATQTYPGAIYAIGNAPTALFALADAMEAGVRPALVVGVPVGFVNVVEAKERVLAVCRACKVPAIVALGRKGGSTVAAAICNALLYEATNALDPAARGWR